MPIWTKDQQQAIDARNNMLLVSAAAGSGKTAVLVERILSLIKHDGLQVDRMLLVTFTRAAAAEMRERILKSLNDAGDIDHTLREQALKVDRASISTLHVFCGQVIREHFQAAGLDPTARLIEGGEQEVLYQEAMKDVLLAAYEKGKDDFTTLSQQFADEAIMDMVDSLYRFLMSLPEPWRWLRCQLANFPNEDELASHVWSRQIIKSMQLQIQGASDAANELMKCLDDPFADCSLEALLIEDVKQIQLLMSAVKISPEELRLAWERKAFPRFPSMKKKEPETAAWAEVVKNKRSDIRSDLGKVVDGAPKNMKLAALDVLHTKASIRALGRLVHGLYKQYEKYKREKNVYDFNDLEHKTLKVLGVPQIRAMVQSKFDAVCIDEYQDISGIQEAILQAVHGGKRVFLVGDVKQSIYRFRLADPTLFLNKAKASSLDKHASFRRISLQQNFRSSHSVVQAVNQVFSSVMREEVTEINYDREAMLVAGREPGDEAPVELHVLTPNEDEPEGEESMEEAPSRVEREAGKAAQIIRGLLTKEFFDKETKLVRPYTFRDIAVLLPKAKNTARVVALSLQKEGIPVYSEADEEYFGLPEIATMMAVLQVLDNPMQDIPLLTTLRSPCFALDEKTLSLIRLGMPGNDVPFYESFYHCAGQDSALGMQCQGILDKLDAWRFLARCLPLDQLIWQLYMDSGIYLRSGALPAGEIRQANLRLLCERAAAYEKSQSEGLHGFLLHGESLKKSGDATTAKVLGEKEDVVRIMTIHKSKGLEFPAVVVMELGSKLHAAGHSSLLKAHRELGLSIPCVYDKERTKTKTIAEKAIQLKAQEEEKAERARLLYVAMTRARERLILIGTVSGKNPESRWKLPEGPYRVQQADSMLDWVIQTVYPLKEAAVLQNFSKGFSTGQQDDLLEKEKKCTTSTGYPQDCMSWRIYVWPEYGQRSVEKKENIHTQIERLMQMVGVKTSPDMALRMKEKPAEEEDRLPLKTSVTSLCKQKLLPEYFMSEQEETPDSKARPEELVMPLRLSPMPARPGFLEKKAVTAADLGTATHKALGLLPLSGLRQKSKEDLRHLLENGLQELMHKGLLTKAQHDGLYVDWLVNFLLSNWGKRMLEATEVHREWAFNLRINALPPALLQGVIDCCFIEDGAWVLMDYKTDVVIDEQAVYARYGTQLQIYKRALQEITGIPVKETILYLLRSGRGLVMPDMLPAG